MSVRWTERDLARVSGKAKAPRSARVTDNHRGATIAAQGSLAAEHVAHTHGDVGASPAPATIHLTIPAAAPSPNTWKGRHWRTYHRLRRTWDLLVLEAVNPVGTRWVPIPQRVHVILERTGPQLLDEDNLVGSCKPILDALRANGLIFNDDPEHLTLTVTQRKGAACTRIEIWEMPAS